MTATNPPVITRNGVNKSFTTQTFGKKSPKAGKQFDAPVVDVASEDDRKWLGDETINGMVNKNLRLIFADIYEDNLDPVTGVLNLESWSADAADFTAGVAKLGDIEEQLEDLYALQQSYAMDPNFGALDDQDQKTPEAIAIEKEIKDVALKIKPLKAQKVQIELKYGQRAEKRKATKAANEAAAKLAKEKGEAVPA